MESVTLHFQGEDCETEAIQAMLGRDSLYLLSEISDEIRSTLKHGDGKWNSEKLEEIKKQIAEHLQEARWT